MCREFVSWARAKGASQITVAVAFGNQAASSLYRNLGFVARTLILRLDV